jgi:LysM repeat protein
VRQNQWRRFVAPAAFLLAVTIAVVLIRAGLDSGASPATATRPVPAKKPLPKRYWTVRAGDTFAVIATQTGVPVARIRKLNPKSSSTSLHIGQKVRIR